MDIQDVMGCLSFARPLWIPACAGTTGECAGMTLRGGIAADGLRWPCSTDPFGRDNVVLRVLSVNVLSVKRVSRRPAPTPTS